MVSAHKILVTAWLRHLRRETLIRVLHLAVAVLLGASFVVLVGEPVALAQITVKNPGNVPLPDSKLQAMFRTARQVVAEEFHIKDPANLDFPLTLVLGQPFRYTADDENQQYTIYLDRWDDTLFISSVVMLASHRAVTKERYQKMVVEVLRRARGFTPISVEALRKAP